MVHKVGQFQIFSSECLRQSGSISECEMRVLFEINIFLSLFNIVYTLFQNAMNQTQRICFQFKMAMVEIGEPKIVSDFQVCLGIEKKNRIRSINLVVYIVLKKSKQEIIKIILVKILQALMIAYVLIEMLRFMYFKSGFFQQNSVLTLLSSA